MQRLCDGSQRFIKHIAQLSRRMGEMSCAGEALATATDARPSCCMTSPDQRAERGLALLQQAISAGRIPGGVIGVLDLATGARAVRAEGSAQLVPDRREMRVDSIFDLASVTKPVFTATQLLRLVEAGRIGLDDTLASVIPDLRQYDVAGAAERRLTFRQCLAHQTQLPPVWPVYTYGDDPDRLRAFILQCRWIGADPGPVAYSDINYMLLGIARERLHDKPLIAIDPGPGFSFCPDPALCAATEHCRWRGRVICGQVHDENAYALGGAAGHAGLFGTADALLDYAADLMGGRLLGDAMRAEMFRRHGQTRTVGWEAMGAGWLGGDRCSPASIGHTGFTGTGLWIDPESGLSWVLLTNRVHPSRHTESGIATLRRAVGAAVV